VEAVVGLLSLADGWVPGSPGTVDFDPAMGIDYRRQGGAARIRTVLSNSFGFGGSNCALIVGAPQ